MLDLHTHEVKNIMLGDKFTALKRKRLAYKIISSHFSQKSLSVMNWAVKLPIKEKDPD